MSNLKIARIVGGPLSFVLVLVSVDCLYAQRPFVTSVVPVVGNGAVGGVLANANGVVSRAGVDILGKLKAVRLQSLGKISGELAQTSQLRKISLRRLEAAIVERRKLGQTASDEMQYLAGLQRIRFVFVYPEQNDIVLAGFAEGWKVDDEGELVGLTTGCPVLQLDDLIVALRSAEASVENPISCSIDPTQQGVGRLRRFSRTRGLRMSRATVVSMEKALGPQKITVTGVSATTHFAQVMVAADFRMKRLAMNFESAKTEGLPSYMELLKSISRPPRNMMPRWWLAPKYEPLLKDAEGLTWELRGSGVQGMTEQDADLVAKRWAQLLTDNYRALSDELPIFAKLRNCMDLAVIAALIVNENLTERAGYSIPLLLDAKQIEVAHYHVPKTVASLGSYVKKGRGWIISVSGGVDVDAWSVLEKIEISEDVSAFRAKSFSKTGTHWWWD